MQNNGNFDITKYINDDTIRKATAIQGIIKGITAIVICVIAFISPLLTRMKESGVDLLITVSNGFTILLIIIGIIGLFMTLRNLLALILQLTGRDETEFGQKYVMFMVVMEASAGYLFAVAFGVLFVIFSLFAFIEGPNNLAEGTTVEGLYIVSGVFFVAGLCVVIHGIVGIVKCVKAVINISNEGHF